MKLARGLPLLLVAACSSGPQVIRETSEPKRPDWVEKTPQWTANTLFFVGATSGSSSLDEGKSGAMAKALDEASRYVGVKVIAEGSYSSSSEQAGDTAKEKVTAASSAKISGAQVTMSYYEVMKRMIGGGSIDRYDVWVLVKLPRVEVDKERARQFEEKNSKGRAAFAAYSGGRRAEDAGDLEGALARYREATEILGTLDEAVDVGDAAFKSSRELEGTVKERLAATTRSLKRVLVASIGMPATHLSVVSAALTKSGYELALPEAMEADDAPAALERARAIGAKILIALAAFDVQQRGQVLGQSAAGCTLTLRAIEVATGKVVLEIAHEAKGFGPNAGAAAQDAGRNAGTDAAKKLLSALQARWGLEQKARADR